MDPMRTCNHAIYLSWKSPQNPPLSTRLAAVFHKNPSGKRGTKSPGISMQRPYLRKTLRFPRPVETPGSESPIHQTPETLNPWGGSQIPIVCLSRRTGGCLGCFFVFFLPVEKGFGLEVALNPVSAWKKILIHFIFVGWKVVYIRSTPHPVTVTNEGL